MTQRLAEEWRTQSFIFFLCVLHSSASLCETKKFMPQLLQYYILIPLIGFLISLILPRKKEKLISLTVITTVLIHSIGTLFFIVFWIKNNCETIDFKHLVLYKSPSFEFFIDYYFDKITAVFVLVGSLLTLLVAIFSRFYLHRESGFKRFFNTLLLFFLGYNLVVVSGNFETLFVGWELLGISSFLLIAFYRDRYLPVKNGFKVLSFYRLGDICLMLAMWMSHHLWHKNITFSYWNDVNLVSQQFQEHFPAAIFIAIMVLIAAVIKSAQLPFSTWLPRAMEGPTTSSAIFYGSLSVHIGAFLLLRTYPFWQNQWLITGLIIAIGLSTSLVATTIARVQSSVKTQIAYSSIAQIGLIFIEIALGFHVLALVHFAGNAFLRTYQLLVSPSVLGYLTHDMFFNFKPNNTDRKGTFLDKISDTIYVLSIKEWNLDFLLNYCFWKPFKWIGGQLNFINKTAIWIVILLSGIVGLLFIDKSSGLVHVYFPLFFALVGLLMVLSVFSERGDAKRAWIIVSVSQVFTLFSILFNGEIDLRQIVFYLSGTTVAALVGYICLQKTKAIDNDIDLNNYHGYGYEQPWIAFVFLLSGLALAGFPISPTFIGIDLLFTNIHAHQIILVGLTALNFLFLELTLIRIYSRVFMGQHKKMDHPVAFKSS